MNCRVGARRQCCVPNDCFGIGVPMMGIGKLYAIVQQIAKATFTEMNLVSFQEVTAQLVNRNLQHEPRPQIFLGN
jgi:hypothetical protein